MAILLACLLSLGGIPTAQAADHEVLLRTFDPPRPQTLTIDPGDTVTFRPSNNAANLRDVFGDYLCYEVRRYVPCTITYNDPGTYSYTKEDWQYPSDTRFHSSGTIVVSGTPVLDLAFTSSTPAVVSGVVSFAGTARDPSGVAEVYYRLNDEEWTLLPGTTSWSFDIDTRRTLLNGPATVEVRAYSNSGGVRFQSVSLTVDNPDSFDLVVLDVYALDPAIMSGQIWCHFICFPTVELWRTYMRVEVASQSNQPVTFAIRFQYEDAAGWQTVSQQTVTMAPLSQDKFGARWESYLHYGDYNIRVLLDPANAVAELDEGNNEGTATIAKPVTLAGNSVDTSGL